MKNKLSYFLESKIRIKVTGKNAYKFIQKLASTKIELLNIKQVKRDTVYVWIYKKDYPNVYRLTTIYNIEIVDSSGWIKIKKSMNVNTYFILSLVVGLVALIILTNLIFSVEVIHNNKETRDFIIRELKNYDIDKYHFKKNYQELNNIKKDIILK